LNAFTAEHVQDLRRGHCFLAVAFIDRLAWSYIKLEFATLAILLRKFKEVDLKPFLSRGFVVAQCRLDVVDVVDFDAPLRRTIKLELDFGRNTLQGRQLRRP